MTQDAFWIVWNPMGQTPTFKHETRKAAVAEAERLARMNRGETFIVCQSVTARVVQDLQTINYEPDEEIPF